MSKTAPAARRPFWETKRLDEMSGAEWESLCDGCGKCCLILLEDEDSGRLYETHIGCRLFDVKRRRCTDYKNRSKRVRDCVRLTPDNAAALDWMPETCAYRRLANGQGLPDWHPLKSGVRKSVADAGAAATGVVLETEIDPDDIWNFVTATRARARKRKIRAAK